MIAATRAGFAASALASLLTATTLSVASAAHGVNKGGNPVKNPVLHHPVHGSGSSHNPIVRHPPLHGAGSSHDPIVRRPKPPPPPLH